MEWKPRQDAGTTDINDGEARVTSRGRSPVEPVRSSSPGWCVLSALCAYVCVCGGGMGRGWLGITFSSSQGFNGRPTSRDRERDRRT